MKEEKRNMLLSKIKTQPLKKIYPKPCNYEKSNSPRTHRPRAIEKVNKTLGKKEQMKECYWRMPDKNMMGETTMQTICS